MMLSNLILGLWVGTFSPTLVNKGIPTLPSSVTNKQAVATTTADTLVVDPARLVQLQGIVAPDMIGKAQRIVALSDKDVGAPIYIALNGPGGMVAVSKLLINAMDLVKARGTPVICFTSVMAMSATFNMMMHCSERYALPSAIFLFHPVRNSGTMSLRAIDAMQLAKAMHAIDIDLLTDIKKLVAGPDTTDQDIVENYYAETQWPAAALKEFAKPGWLRIVKNITGAPDLLVFMQDNGFGQLKKQQGENNDAPTIN